MYPNYRIIKPIVVFFTLVNLFNVACEDYGDFYEDYYLPPSAKDIAIQEKGRTEIPVDFVTATASEEEGLNYVVDYDDPDISDDPQDRAKDTGSVRSGLFPRQLRQIEAQNLYVTKIHKRIYSERAIKG